MRAMIVAVVLGMMTLSVRAAHYKSPDGYSFDYPDSWKVIDKENRDEAVADARRNGMALPAETGLHTSCVVADLAPTRAKFAANINVVVTDVRSAVVDEENLKQIRQQFPLTLRQGGMTVTNFQASITRVDGRDAFSLKWLSRVPGLNATMSQWQLLVPVNDKLYTVTFTAAQSDYAAHEKDFKQIAQSLSLAGGLPAWVMGGIAGGGIGAVTGLVLWLVRRKRPRVVPAVPAMAGAPPIPPAPPVAVAPPVPEQATSPVAQAPNEYVYVVCTCGARLRVAKQKSGKTGRCPKCKGSFVVP